ncbi:hypothetical protein H9P43_002687 [Blastocladiella emersonii ATCC 22665]|nr:hypothetical protein H9P43_002687 [Blastocladiella emersonii ATCC 22665]
MTITTTASSLLVLLACLAAVSHGHMEMKAPPPRRSKFNKFVPESQIDYDLNSPLAPHTVHPFPCRGSPAGQSVATLTPGRSVPVELYGTAIHGGGHCQFALSYDEKTWVVLQTVLNDCMLSGLNFDVPLPATTPGGKAVFGWFWVNKEGNREMYANCADVTINGPASGTLRGPKVTTANIPGAPVIGEFAAGADPRVDLYQNQPIVEIGPGFGGPSTVAQPGKNQVGGRTTSAVAPVASATSEAQRTRTRGSPSIPAFTNVTSGRPAQPIRTAAPVTPVSRGGEYAGRRPRPTPSAEPVEDTEDESESEEETAPSRGSYAGRRGDRPATAVDPARTRPGSAYGGRRPASESAAPVAQQPTYGRRPAPTASAAPVAVAPVQQSGYGRRPAASAAPVAVDPVQQSSYGRRPAAVAAALPAAAQSYGKDAEALVTSAEPASADSYGAPAAPAEVKAAKPKCKSRGY